MKRAVFALFTLVAAAGFLWLGVWQLERRAWKLELIAQTEANVTAAPIAPPPAPEWPQISDRDAYKVLRISGTYLSGRDAFVLASTRLGRGYWVMTPLKADSGFYVIVNRGFVTSAQKALLTTPEGPVTVEGLLRLSEPGGSVLQDNQPAAGRWFSRDVTAMAQAWGLSPVAPYFVDVRDASSPLPVAGLTVISFRNNHLQYSLTWFGLSLMCLLCCFIILKNRR